MKIVLHACCAPCLAGTLPAFSPLGEILPYFYNPNVHPFVEFRKRLKAFELYAERQKLTHQAEREYGLLHFLQRVQGQAPQRCGACYADRLERTARLAASIGADAFSSTLVSSVHQDHDMIKAAGEQAAGHTGVKFIYQDLRHCAADGQATAKKLSLYRQQYCGCIYSEYERYKNSTN